MPIPVAFNVYVDRFDDVVTRNDSCGGLSTSNKLCTLRAAVNYCQQLFTNSEKCEYNETIQCGDD